MNSVGLIGFGELGKLAHQWLLESEPSPPGVVVFDDVEAADSRRDAQEFFAFREERFAALAMLVCLGYRQAGIKLQILDELQSAGCGMISVRHARSWVSHTANVEGSCLIGPGAVVDANAHLGAGVVIHCNATVSHDAEISAGAYIAPGAILCGRSSVGSGSFVGAGAVVRDGVRIGNQCQIAMGAVVTADVPDGTSVVGNPMRTIDGKLKL